jgi:hypothetical protein
MASSNQRLYDRLKVSSLSDLTIETINQESQQTEKTDVLVRNISLGGLQFESSLSFPVDDKVILKFQSESYGDLHGVIMWKENVDGLLQYRYGVRFTSLSNQMIGAIFKMSF